MFVRPTAVIQLLEMQGAGESRIRGGNGPICQHAVGVTFHQGQRLDTRCGRERQKGAQRGTGKSLGSKHPQTIPIGQDLRHASGMRDFVACSVVWTDDTLYPQWPGQRCSLV